MNQAPTKFSLLFVDDEPQILRLLEQTFVEEDYDIHTATGGQDALELLEKIRIDGAVVDLVMPGINGLELLKKIKKAHPAVMVIILTGVGVIDDVVQAIKLGAVDFLQKPFSPEGLRVRISQLHKIWELKEENRKLREKMESQFGFRRLIGNSTAVLKLKEMIAKVGPTDTTVLIQGETGTGKELVARATHYHSRRSEMNFVPVDCAAISESVIESELFGHAKGSFTGAYASALGLIRSADKGTLFLDEVAELSPAIQAKLLRTIQEKEVRAVGDTRSYSVDVRILAATNRDLTEEVIRGNFREDLLFRLNMLILTVPPLRDRKDDVPLLARYFLNRYATDFSPVTEISEEALFCFENYDWPGNVRELENIIRRAIALGRQDSIGLDDLPAPLFTPPKATGQPIAKVSGDSLAAYEIEAIQNALRKSANNRSKAARKLGIGEATLYRKIKKYGI